MTLTFNFLMKLFKFIIKNLFSVDNVALFSNISSVIRGSIEQFEWRFECPNYKCKEKLKIFFLN